MAVYDSWNDTDGSGPWIEIGGTSVAAPAWAGLIAIANQGRGGASLDGATQTLPALYNLPSADFHDITSGSNGDFSAGPGYDEVTGLGTPQANLLVPALAAYGAATKMAITAEPPCQRHRRRFLRDRGLGRGQCGRRRHHVPWDRDSGPGQ